MFRFASTSYKHQCDQELLDRLIAIILVLKLDAQGRLFEHGRQAEEAIDKRQDLIRFLEDLINRVRFLISGDLQVPIDLTFTGLADRFVEYNPEDVEDRLEEVGRLRVRLINDQKLREQDFHLL